jgi:hypothetical protein
MIAFMSSLSMSRDTAGTRATSLDAVLVYRHLAVVAPYMREFGGNQSAAEEFG